MDNQNRKWLVAYVKTHHERKVRDRFKQIGIECFLPIKKELRQWSDRKKLVEVVLIPSLIFVNINADEHLKVLQTPSVSRFMKLKGDNSPAIIPDHEMKNFQQMIENAENEVFITSENIKQGEKVLIKSGSLKGIEGELVRIDKKSKLLVRIEQLGCAYVEIDMEDIETLG